MADTSWWRDPAELVDEQRRVIDLPKDESFLVLGPPGSGKTNLLLLRAQYLVAGGRPNVSVLMFTKTLRRFVMSGGTNYNFAAEKVQTFFSWQTSILREHGVEVPTDRNFDKKRKELAARTKEVFDRKPALEHQIECILVDEVQDALPEEVDLFFRAGRTVFLVGDGRQMIYQRNGVLQDIAERLGPNNVRKLTLHYRNGRKICQVADAIGAQMGEPAISGTCNYREAENRSSANFESCATEAEQLEKLMTRLKTQLNAFPDELLGIACAKGSDAGKIRTALMSSSLGDYVCEEDELHDPFRPEARIFVSTIHDAKGLEFRTMHLPFIEQVRLFRDRQKRVSYTAVTRAKTSLTVYSTKSLPPHLEQAREVTVGTRPDPDINSLFPSWKA